ncbi:MAG TPA: glycyl-radical enzyme activating protein [Desulfovibrio sp.]|uniref:glycyl-radical enzyme activating protein n=1 Tax=Desulfovibrio TaxID=872 RepID=UPI000401BFC4|nr:MULTISPECIES: glycyl-radical enzyme activating protein [Desulfovibrio]HMM38215.1 glycyl-radical enzyme activating protein [Desulfovibrio sp.]
MQEGMVYNIQRMSVQDGPGLRTTVFLKGCPLHCIWCSNPESQKFAPQMMYFENLCTGCGACANACPNGAVVLLENGKFGRDPEKCTDCGVCTEVCPRQARVMSGKIMTVEEVMEVVRKDELFYLNSDGGVTFGGGEPTAGGDFFLALLQQAHDEAYHCTVDTCGCCPEDRFSETIRLADLLLFDCKHMDPERHKALTGQGNALILKNMRNALSSDTKVRIRMPLMPGLNDTEENLAAMADFFGEFHRHEIEIMPCHFFGRNKYLALNLSMPPLRQYTPEELRAVEERFGRYGLKPVIV